MALSMPIPCVVANAHPGASALTGRGLWVRPSSKSFPPFHNHLHKQLTFHKNSVRFRNHFTVFSSSAKLAESTIVVWDAALAQEGISTLVPAPEPQPEPLFISILLIAAFIGLSLVSIGVVYLGVTEFLEKRERDKVLKEEETKAESKTKIKRKGKGKGRGKGKGKGIILAKYGPGGFGQKENEDD